MKLATERSTARAMSRGGWLGIDIGTHALKFAQVTRAGDGWRLQNWFVTPRGEEESGVSWRNPLRAALRQIEQETADRAACVLPADLCDLRVMKLPAGTTSEWRDIVAGELEDDFPGESREFDLWSTDSTPSETNTAFVVSVPTDEVNELTSLLRAFDLTCETVDAVPVSLMRATQMLADDDPVDDAQLAIDWGLNSLTISVIVERQIIFSRILPEAGLSRILQPVAREFGLRSHDAVMLLRRTGLPRLAAESLGPVRNAPPVKSAQSDHLRTQVHRLAQNGVVHAVAEIERTLSFCKGRLKSRRPGRIVLFGAGATIDRATTELSKRLQIPCRAWSLPTVHPARTEVFDPRPLLGPAAALSALAFDSAFDSTR